MVNEQIQQTLKNIRFWYCDMWAWQTDNMTGKVLGDVPVYQNVTDNRLCE